MEKWRFELTKVVEAIPGLNIYLEEKNIIPFEYNDEKLESKGFLPEIYIQDFPIRNQKVYTLHQAPMLGIKSTDEIVAGFGRLYNRACESLRN